MGTLGGVDDDEVSEDKAAEDEVEVDGFGREARKKDCEPYGSEKDTDEEAVAVPVVEAMAGFEGGFVWGLGVEAAVGGVERPDSEEHGKGGAEGKVDAVGGGNEAGPEDSYGGSVE
ncbi:MAG: hypothetical protein JWQ42_2316 [Edaphobacter sp.]|nr:hypothetical protein [Edaphobacter sp.]